ncbi:MAG TPA: four helix bundle protein [Gemmatimonadales bacterium]|jgi:four helix bundle protein|nr:four helix bundle protein [Gemmatimonadales bacterium]
MANVEDLRVMSLARELVVATYRATSGFPAHERFGLANQMRRAAISIGSNIAEGAGRQSDREFARFVKIARGSAHELAFQITTSGDLEFLATSEVAELTARVTDLSRMLRGLAKSLDA